MTGLNRPMAETRDVIIVDADTTVGSVRAASIWPKPIQTADARTAAPGWALRSSTRELSPGSVVPARHNAGPCAPDIVRDMHWTSTTQSDKLPR